MCLSLTSGCKLKTLFYWRYSKLYTMIEKKCILIDSLQRKMRVDFCYYICIQIQPTYRLNLISIKGSITMQRNQSQWYKYRTKLGYKVWSLAKFRNHWYMNEYNKLVSRWSHSLTTFHIYFVICHFEQTWKCVPQISPYIWVMISLHLFQVE